jgi:hypothetical protein
VRLQEHKQKLASTLFYLSQGILQRERRVKYIRGEFRHYPVGFIDVYDFVDLLASSVLIHPPAMLDPYSQRNIRWSLCKSAAGKIAGAPVLSQRTQRRRKTNQTSSKSNSREVVFSMLKMAGASRTQGQDDW